MSISLFPHNREAYEAVCALLPETGKACVIHPTGTGKSFIGFKLCEEHTEERVRWLSPSEYIFKTQLVRERACAAARCYWEQKGNPDIPGVYKTDDSFGPGLRLKMQREYERSGSLSDDRRKELEEIGMEWEKKDLREEKHELLEQYHAEYSHLKMSNRYKYGGVYLTQWLTTQRARLNGKGKPLTPEQRQKLRTLGIGASGKPTHAERRPADAPAVRASR